MRRIRVLLISGATLGLVTAAGCGPAQERGDESAKPTASKPAGAPATKPVEAAPEAPAPPAQPAAQAPLSMPSSASVDRGAQVYGTYCSSCHGASGEGDGPVAAGLNPKPAKHSDGSYMNPLSDAHLFKVVKLGGPAVGKSPLMAPWGGTLTDEQVWDLVAFMRSLAKPPYQPAG